MRTLKLSACVLCLGLSFGGSTAFAMETEESFQAAYAAAEAARKHAASVKGEWRDTGKMLKKAKSLAEKGDYDQAVKIAMEAKFQGERGAEQAIEQSKIWMDAVPK